MKLLDFGSLNIDHCYQLPHLVRPGETIGSSHYQRNGGGKGSDGGQGGDGCIIIYYRKKKELQSGPLVTSNNLGLLDSLGRRMIV